MFIILIFTGVDATGCLSFTLCIFESCVVLYWNENHPFFFFCCSRIIWRCSFFQPTCFTVILPHIRFFSSLFSMPYITSASTHTHILYIWKSKLTLSPHQFGSLKIENKNVKDTYHNEFESLPHLHKTHSYQCMIVATLASAFFVVWIFSVLFISYFLSPVDLRIAFRSIFQSVLLSICLTPLLSWDRAFNVPKFFHWTNNICNSISETEIFSYCAFASVYIYARVCMRVFMCALTICHFRYRND